MKDVPMRGGKGEHAPMLTAEQLEEMRRYVNREWVACGGCGEMMMREGKGWKLMWHGTPVCSMSCAMMVRRMEGMESQDGE